MTNHWSLSFPLTNHLWLYKIYSFKLYMFSVKKCILYVLCKESPASVFRNFTTFYLKPLRQLQAKCLNSNDVNCFHSESSRNRGQAYVSISYIYTSIIKMSSMRRGFKQHCELHNRNFLPRGNLCQDHNVALTAIFLRWLVAITH